jgi:hypothetical protein
MRKTHDPSWMKGKRVRLAAELNMLSSLNIINTNQVRQSLDNWLYIALYDAINVVDIYEVSEIRVPS